MNDSHTGSNGSTAVLNFRAAGRLISSLFSDELAEEADPNLPQIGGYAVRQLLGQGGGGQVFLATKESSGKNVAVKLLNKTIANRNAAERAWRELDVLTDLHLAGIPPIEDYGIHENRMFIVTAHVEGLTLADHCTQQNLNRWQRVELLASVADCVQRLHEHGVIHRDIKPDNIIINREGQPVIIDFGIASLLTQNPTETLTQDGAPIGTIAYMAPEQARGDRQHTSTRSDVYALGATACLVLTGKTPHDVSGPLAAAIGRVANDPPRHPTDLDPTLDRGLASVLSRAINTSPDERYPSAAAFAEDLRRWLRNEPIEWQRPNWFRRQKLAWKRDRNAFLTRAAVAAVLLACFVTTALAVANARVANQKQVLAEGQLELREKEAQLNEVEAQRAAHWQKEAETQKQRRVDRENDLLEARKKQIDRVKLAIDQGALFDATIVLLNIAELIQINSPDDKEVLDSFVSLLNEVIDEAKKKVESTPK